MIKYVVFYTPFGSDRPVLVSQYDSLEEAKDYIRANVMFTFTEERLQSKRFWKPEPVKTLLEITELYVADKQAVAHR